MMLRMEISQASIVNCTVETKTKLTNDVMRLLQVRDKNEGMAKDWLLFLSTTPKFNNLAPGEIYEAFKMAMARELLDADGKEINLLPELSINTTSKVLISYFEWKKTNPEYQDGKKTLLSLNNPSGPTEEQKLQIRLDFLKSVFDDLNKNGKSTDAWLLYDDIKDKLIQTNEQKKNIYKQQEFLYIRELKYDAEKNKGRRSYTELLESAQNMKSNGKYIPVVQNRCKAIMVCDYLMQFKNDFEQFKKAING